MVGLHLCLKYLHVPGLHQKGILSVSLLGQVTDSNVYVNKSGMHITINGSIVIIILPAKGLYVLAEDNLLQR